MPDERSHENLISSYVKKHVIFTCEILSLLWLHNKSCLSQQKTMKMKWFGNSLVFI